MFEACWAVILIEMEYDLRIAVGEKCVAACQEMIAKFDVVEDLAVERDPEVVIFIGHRLCTAGKIDDAETGMA